MALDGVKPDQPIGPARSAPQPGAARPDPGGKALAGSAPAAGPANAVRTDEAVRVGPGRSCTVGLEPGASAAGAGIRLTESERLSALDKDGDGVLAGADLSGVELRVDLGAGPDSTAFRSAADLGVVRITLGPARNQP